MFDLDKLSYETYGILVIVVLTIIATLLNLFPFSLIGLITCIGQIPIYLYARHKFAEPIHAEGLNKCFVLTILFYILLFICIKGLLALTNIPVAIVVSILITMNGHIVCSKYGIIYDTFDCRDREVETVWLVK